MELSQPRERAASARQGTVLIIDDDPEIAILERTVLERAGFECLVAHHADEVFELLTPEVALVLLDVLMPGQTGPEILGRIRSEPTLADVPVVFVTGRGDAETRLQCLTMGAVDVLQKPFSPKALREKVATIVEETSTRDDAPERADPLEAALAAGGATYEAAPADEHHRMLSALFRLHQAIRAETSLEELAGSVVQLSRKALGARVADLWIRSGEGLRSLASTRDDGGTAATPEDGPAGRAWREWLMVEAPGEGRDVTGLHFPLTTGADRIGVLSLEFARERRPSPQLAGFFAASAALALDSSIRFEKARSEALTDPLTGVRNRRYMENRLGEELQRARTFQTELSLLFIDVDRFKLVNDVLGHDVGDQVLCALSGIFAGQVRVTDTLARYGGDEFVVILPETGGERASTVAGRMKELVHAFRDQSDNEINQLSVTIGMATYPADGERAEDLIQKADEAMLRGKRSGRDQVLAAEASAEPSIETEGEVGTAAAMLRRLLGALDMRDAYTGQHSRSVAAWSARLARRLGCEVDGIREAGRVGLLHDIGKLHTPTEILNKPGPLDDDEREIMERHAEVGGELTEAVSALADLAPAVRASQEHFDGTGYPAGMAGNQIPLSARIVAVADAYDAMVTDRPYRAATTVDLALAELRRCAGTQFDPEVVDALADLTRPAA